MPFIRPQPKSHVSYGTSKRLVDLLTQTNAEPTEDAYISEIFLNSTSVGEVSQQ